MKKAKIQSAGVDESLKAIPGIDNCGDLIGGLMTSMDALLKGEITAKEASAITKAANRQRLKISRGVLKG